MKINKKSNKKNPKKENKKYEESVNLWEEVEPLGVEIPTDEQYDNYEEVILAEYRRMQHEYDGG